MVIMAKRGKLIVIDGTDGSGKATQVELLAKHLELEGYTVKLVDFPEYYKNFFGKFIGHCLTEQYYNFIKVHPKIASVLYAADRWESKDEIEGWLKKGHIVIANRYASANQIHQGGKIKSSSKRAAFIRWLDEMEYEVFKIPRPDAVFYLRVPMSFILKLIRERNKKISRAYAGKKKDIVEGDTAYLENSGNAALWLAKTQKNWVKIECVRKNSLLSREAIHGEIYKKVKTLIKK
jgi:dTMP kinase